MRDIKKLLDEIPESEKVEVDEITQCDRCGNRIYILGGVKAGCDCELLEQSLKDINRYKSSVYAKNSIITDVYKRKRLNDYKPSSTEQQTARKIAIAYIIEFEKHLDTGKSLMLQGGFGTGKTHIAASIFNALVERNYKVYFISLPEYLDVLKSSFDDEQKKYDIKEMVREADLLIIDDIGANRLTDFAIEELFKMADARIGKCTVYTTNLSVKDFEDSIDLERAFSRMMENTKIISLQGEDYRRRDLK